MIELLTIFLFAFVLILSIVFNFNLIFALLIGFVIFVLFGLYRKVPFSILLKEAFLSALKVKNLVITFFIIGFLTGVWRASGTISTIVYYGITFLNPKYFIFFTFFLNGIVSTLIGTSFGTSATMGVICISIARVMNVDLYLTAGAVLSGCYVGDRCSMLSTSAMLVAESTNTYIYDNIKLMIKTSILPILVTSLIYILLGFKENVGEVSLTVLDLFEKNFTLDFVTLIPAILVIVLALFKFPVKKTIIISALTSFVIALVAERVPFFELVKYSVFGYELKDEVLNEMIKGGGFLSMVRAMTIVFISSSYLGIFKVSHLTEGILSLIKKFSDRVNVFFVMIVSSFVTALISSNQTLGILLVNDLFKDVVEDRKRAIYLENSIVTIAGLIPWNIACSYILGNLEVGSKSVIYAFYLMLIPFINLIMIKKKK